MLIVVQHFIYKCDPGTKCLPTWLWDITYASSLMYGGWLCFTLTLPPTVYGYSQNHSLNCLFCPRSIIEPTNAMQYFILCMNLRMYVCMYVCIYVCMYVFMYLCMYVCMYLCMYVRMYVCMYICMYVCMYMYVCMHACTYLLTYLCMYICKYVCMYVCMYVCHHYQRQL